MTIENEEYAEYKSVIVSKSGVVRAVGMNNRVRNPFINCGYAMLKVRTAYKKYSHIGVHRLVWLAWKGPIPNGYEINHRDGNKLNNCLDNLELMTRQQNMQHAKENKLFFSGIRNPTRAEAMKVLASNGWSRNKIGNAFGITAVSVTTQLGRYNKVK